MIVSRPTHADAYQLRLFDEPLGNHGHVRTVLGDLTEILTAKVLGGRRHICSSQAEYCPDVSVKVQLGTHWERQTRYFECKSMGRTNRTFVYAGRLEKDACFVATGHELYYAIWSHSLDTKRPATINELIGLWLQSLEWLALVPFDVIDQWCLWRCPERLNSKYYGPTATKHATYGSGYRIPRSLIEPWKFMEWRWVGD